MKPYFVGIAGGTGSGKTTVCLSLLQKYPELVSLIHFDDYQKRRKELPILYGMANWDHPESINFPLLLNDLKQLKQGKPITIQSWQEQYKPTWNGTEFDRVPVIIEPKRVILMEGYLALWHPHVRSLMDCSVFLQLSESKRLQRRNKKVGDEEYNQKILIPMHRQFVEPTKKFAQHVISVDDNTREKVLEKVEKILQPVLAKK